MDSEEQSDTFKDMEAETNQMPKYINQALDRSIDNAQKQAAKAVSITYIVDVLRERPLMTSLVFWLFLTYLPTYVPFGPFWKKLPI